MIARKRNASEYTNLFILVCNIPDERYATRVEKKILNGIKTKWIVEHDDPRCERLHIIYLQKGDQTDNPKFAPLNNADRKSKIYIVGHCAPGADAIRSNEIYIDEEDSKKKVSCQFTFVDLACILMRNISNTEIRVDRDEGFHHLMSKSRKLKVCLMGCYTATDEKSITGTVIEQSFASKFTESMHNGFNTLFICDVVGVTGLMIPFGTKPDLANYLKYIFGSSAYEPGFHKRHMQYPYIKGNFSFNLFSYASQHKPDDNYKIRFVPSPNTTAKDVLDQDIRYIELGLLNGKNHAIEQDNGERTLQLINYILNNKDLNDMHKHATLILYGIRTGRISNDELIHEFSELMAKLNDHFKPSAAAHKP